MCKDDLDRTARTSESEIRHVLGVVMGRNERLKLRSVPKLFDVVELLADRSAAGLGVGAVGTIVDELESGAYLVEFTDDEGRTLAIEALEPADFAIRP